MGHYQRKLKFVEENGNHKKERGEFYMIDNVTCKQVWIHVSPPYSDAITIQIVNLETQDHISLLKAFSNSNHPMAIQFCNFV